ncbi:glycoside hydrolase family 26 protein [Changchengzhania lutea]|uniref:hypothetical protein n=1 Tax=Changchengzhania lutea TaxID=2049305 RepID=UPI00115CFBB5|nr:hypothetical protein [Changchengzhania lutea]
MIVTIITLPFVIRHKSLVKDLLTIRFSNKFEKTESSPVLAVFSFKDLDKNRLIDLYYHYNLKLAQPNGIIFDKVEVKKFSNDTIPLIITIETWGSNMFLAYRKNQMADLYSGKYDEVIKTLCTTIVNKRPNVYFRLNPEIEVPYKRYPWQGYVSEYIKASEYLVSLCQKYAPQVKYLWGPSGYPGVLEYYPGDKSVDAASVILKNDSEEKLDAYPKHRSIKYDLIRRLHRLRFLDKPIFVFGSNNNFNDSIDANLVASISKHIEKERKVIYSSDNFKRPRIIKKDTIESKLEIGLYDPQNLLNNELAVSVEHLFVDFSSLNNGSFQLDFDKVIKRNHDVIVTFEPFRIPGKDDDLNVLQHVTEGMYDSEIEKLYAIILNTERKVYLRYAHEMEIPITRYPWQSQDPITYIKSYRYFMMFKGAFPANIKRVWGPAGDRGSIEWYPGNDVVDIMSMAIYGLPDKNITDPNKQLSFSTIFNLKSKRLKFIDKPLFITEFGVKGPEDYQTKWLEDAAKVLNKNTQVLGVNYFNMSDTPKAWGDIKPPDWSITKKTFHHFLNMLNDQ